MEKKYELTDEILEHKGHVLHRIRAIKDIVIPEHDDVIEAGTLGGWVESEKNLSQKGTCWIDDNAKVFEKAKVYGCANVGNTAEVFDKAKIHGHAFIFCKAFVHGSAEVFEHGSVFGKATVYENAKVYGNTSVSDNAKIHGHARVFGDTDVIQNATICGTAKVYGRNRIFGNAVIHSNAVLLGGHCWSVIPGQFLDLLDIGGTDVIGKDAYIKDKNYTSIIPDYGPNKKVATVYLTRTKGIRVEYDGCNYTLNEFRKEVKSHPEKFSVEDCLRRADLIENRFVRL